MHKRPKGQERVLLVLLIAAGMVVSNGYRAEAVTSEFCLREIIKVLGKIEKGSKSITKAKDKHTLSFSDTKSESYRLIAMESYVSEIHMLIGILEEARGGIEVCAESVDGPAASRLAYVGLGDTLMTLSSNSRNHELLLGEIAMSDAKPDYWMKRLAEHGVIQDNAWKELSDSVMAIMLDLLRDREMVGTTKRYLDLSTNTINTLRDDLRKEFYYSKKRGFGHSHGALGARMMWHILSEYPARDSNSTN